MKICYFGIYNHSYSRNSILISGLRQNGIEVIECRSEKGGFFKYADLIQKHRKIRETYDCMIVGFPGYQSMILARFLTPKPIIFDCFASAYDSLVFDRKQVRNGSIRARYYWFLDWLSMRIADRVLFDTQAHIDYASKEFGISKTKFRRMWIGADTTVFFPRFFCGKLEQGFALRSSSATVKGETLRKVFHREQQYETEKSKDFTVLFFGTFIPLQGIEYIVESAKFLEGKNIVFCIIGGGQLKEKIRAYAKSKQVKNIEFIDKMSQQELSQKITESDVCLGIFGNTAKTQRVIPNKVYECLAMKKPVITADTLAARELLGDKDVCFVKSADSVSLAGGILRFKNDRNAMERIAQNGYDTFIKNATPEILGRELRGIVRELIETRK